MIGTDPFTEAAEAALRARAAAHHQARSPLRNRLFRSFSQQWRGRPSSLARVESEGAVAVGDGSGSHRKDAIAMILPGLLNSAAARNAGKEVRFLLGLGEEDEVRE